MKKTNIKKFLLLPIIILTLCFSLFFVTGCDQSSNNNNDNKQEQTTYTVSFDFNGEKNDKVNIVVNENELVKEIDVTKYTSKELEGWYYNDTKWDFANSKVNSNITLVAKWVEVVKYYAVFNSNGGSGSTEDVEFVPGEDFTIPEYIITKRGYEFLGWEYNGNLYKANDTVVIDEENDVEFIAKLERLYTITLKGEGESDKVEINNVKNNSKVTLQKNTFVKEGYNFIGWATEVDGEVVYTDNQEITFEYTKDVTLYAKWEKALDVNDVIKAINDLGDITYGSVNEIKEARALYNKLPESESTKVTNYQKLIDAERDIVVIYIQVLENATYTASDITLARELLDGDYVVKESISNLDVLYIAEYKELNKTKYSNAVNDLAGVITETGYAYNYQSNQIQYDQFNGRRNINATPEMATSERIIYLDCSSYVNSVFNYVFGVNVLGADLDVCNTKAFNAYCATYSDQADVIYYVVNANYTTAESKSAILTEVKNGLQVGDILIYRHGATSGSSGHVMLYIGNNTWLHATGNSTDIDVGKFDPTTYTDKTTTAEAKIGSIQVLGGNELFYSSGARYLFKATSTDTVYSFGVIRMLNRTGLTLTQRAIDRYVLSGKVTLEKKASVDLYKSVRLNDEITYTIEAKNYDSVDKTKMYAIEYLPAEVEFVSADNNGVYNSDKHMIIWQFDTVKNATTTLTYKVKVKNDNTNIGKTINDGNSNVCGIELNSVKNQIENNSDLSKVVTEANKLVGKAYTNNLDFVKEVYKNAWGVDILTSETNSERTVKDILSYWEITPTAEAYKYLVVDGYGGIKFNTSKNNKYSINYFKLVTPTYLQTGDIIVADTTYTNAVTEYNCFLYLGTDLVLACNNGTVTKQATTVTNVTKFLVTIEAYDRFVVLRPSLVH